MASFPERLAQPVAERVVALVVDALDVDALVAGVDVDALLSRVDLNAVLERVELGPVLHRLDIDDVLARIDVDALIARIDVDALVSRVDVDVLIARTDLAPIVTSTAAGVADDAWRTARRRLAAADTAVARRVDGLLGRPDHPPGPDRDAGAVSRLAAHAVDHVTLSVLFSVGAAVTGFLTDLVAGHRLDSSASVTGGIALALWWFTYFAASWATTGRSPGMALVGVRVVRVDGTPVGAAGAVLRTLAWPLSAAAFGLGFVGILVHPRRRAFHDLVAGTRVTHDDDSVPDIPDPGERRVRAG